ncbi:hypothetical protein [Tissierella praeacuta]|uniref:hypothetical protein n=1 Tax=Tissierella praeacuta TaxID=43131 RepID=UPI001C100EBF|nr:hypothetical protein [Tissierella praeacuta]MBU5256832.1 hypothetical protein [Tissierella praeacuta]
MDKLIQLCFRSIIRQVNGDKDISEQYKDLAMEEYKEHEDTIKLRYENKSHKNHENKTYKSKRYKNKCTYRVEDIIPRKVKKKLYEMVS